MRGLPEESHGVKTERSGRPAHAAASANERFDGKQRYHRRYKDMEPVHAEFMRGSEAEFCVEVLDCEPNFDETFTDWSQRKIFSMRGFGDFAESRFIQAA